LKKIIFFAYRKEIILYIPAQFNINSTKTEVTSVWPGLVQQLDMKTRYMAV